MRLLPPAPLPQSAGCLPTWAGAHIGIPGNDTADVAAKAVAKGKDVPECQFPGGRPRIQLGSCNGQAYSTGTYTSQPVSQSHCKTPTLFDGLSKP